MKIQDKRFLITGSTRGIGRALAEMLAQSGAQVAINGRDKKTLESTAAALTAGGAKVLPLAGDVGKDGDAARIARIAIRELGGVDVLVNNAAILAPRASVVDTPASVWEEVLRINVIGTANMIRHLLPQMAARGSGLIINLSSGWGREASGYVASYCASKFGVEALTQSVSEEAQSTGVIIFALNPGVIATEMLATAFGGDVSAYPPPETLGSRWKKLLTSADSSWHGSSRDL